MAAKAYHERMVARNPWYEQRSCVGRVVNQDYNDFIKREHAARCQMPSACRPVDRGCREREETDGTHPQKTMLVGGGTTFLALPCPDKPDPIWKRSSMTGTLTPRSGPSDCYSTSARSASCSSRCSNAPSIPRQMRSELVYGGEKYYPDYHQGRNYRVMGNKSMNQTINYGKGDDQAAVTDILRRSASLPVFRGEELTKTTTTRASGGSPPSTRLSGTGTSKKAKLVNTQSSDVSEMTTQAIAEVRRRVGRPPFGCDSTDEQALLRTPVMMHMFYPNEGKHLSTNKYGEECRTEPKYA